MDCSKITAGYVQECDVLAKGGTGGKAFLFNYADIDFTETSWSDYDMDVLQLKDGKKGYIFETFSNAIEGTATLNKGAFISNYDHQVTLRAFNRNGVVRQFMAQLQQARVVAVIQTGSENEGYEYEVYGLQSGLVLSENAISTTLTDGVAYSLVLKSDDTSKETHAPLMCGLSEEALTALCQSA